MEKKTKNRKGIRFRLTVIFTLLIALSLFTLGATSFFKSVNVTESKLKDSSLQLVKELNVSITNYLDGIEKFVCVLANSQVKKIRSNPEAIDEIMNEFETFKNSHKDIKYIYIGTKDKKIYPKPSKSYDPTQRPWYKKAIQAKKLIWTKPYKDISTGEYVISAAIPVYDKNNELIGVLAADIALKTLEEMIDGTKIGKKGYPFVLDENGKVIFHKNKELIGKVLPVEKIIKSIETKKEDIVNYKWEEDGEVYEKFVVYSTLEKLNWKVMGNMYVNEIEEETSGILKNTLTVGAVSLLIVVLITYLFATSLTNPIKELVYDMERVKEGDLSVRCNVKNKDEIGQLSENFNIMVEELGKLVGKMKDVSIEVTSSAQNLAATTEVSSASAEEVAAAVEAIAKGAADQAVDAEKGANLTLKLSSKFDQLEGDFDHIRKSAEDVMATSEASVDVVNELKEKTELNNEGTEKIEEAIIDLDHRIQDIGNILETIDAIADQTNLLALNASIEAARAGEAGRGFTVVAEQIRKLSEESRISSDEIKQIITNVQKESEHTVEIMKELKERSLGQSESVEKVHGSFEQIETAVHSITEKIESISKFVNQINNEKELIVKAIENISAVSEETASSSEEVNASMQQQAMIVEEIATAADKLDDLAVKLNSEISRFKV
ncbi:methyl-accepting chemotaxis protein [Crassaminicella thermophila]|uniref:Methyl-accepting chemotaxis protein n=1 Tax=Crassaminicella thermophila TaxID=2599308 RepID=A0A5C0S8M8_CRATE|nr:methyl-accepting chemotaxis protein [Crassaminicella thermophila]QEK11015.1 methyl-accepting chemotaxis protein [Crassaminicella thermophila]